MGVQEQIAQYKDHLFDAIVIGAGQAGLAAAYELKRRNLDFLVLDANTAPGGAWQHRWESLTMQDVHGVADLPAMAAPGASKLAARYVIPAYFARYEKDFQLPIIRPVKVAKVESQIVADPYSALLISTSAGQLRARTLVNATGTWERPFLPFYPGMNLFEGEQFHTVTYPGAEHFAGRRVLVVGGGASAVQFLGGLAWVTDNLLWATRRPPVWKDQGIDGLAAVQWVERRTTAGKAPASVVSSTGLFLREQEEYAASLGVYERRLEIFDYLENNGIRWKNGKFESVDAIIWATGFRPDLSHLAPLKLTSQGGGIALESVSVDVQGATTAQQDGRINLVGYGPSASTIGSRHAARHAAIAVHNRMDKK